MRAALVAMIALGCGAPKPAVVAPPPAAPVPAPPAIALPAPRPPRAKPRVSADVTVTVTGLKVWMNGTEISGKPSVADMIAVLGDPDRTWDPGSGNRVHTWDALGVIVYEPRDGRCISTTFPYKPMSATYDPKTKFSGTIVVDGKRLTPRTTLAAVKTWPGATVPYSPSSVVFDKADIHVFTIEETSPGALDLVELSFWQRGKDGVEIVRAPDARGSTRALELDCKAGDARTCTRLALIFQLGASGDKDFARALGFAKQGCAGNDAFACTMLGNMHEAGAGTGRSHPAALAAWHRACTLGDAVGCERAR